MTSQPEPIEDRFELYDNVKAQHRLLTEHFGVYLNGYRAIMESGEGWNEGRRWGDRGTARELTRQPVVQR